MSNRSIRYEARELLEGLPLLLKELPLYSNHPSHSVFLLSLSPFLSSVSSLLLEHIRLANLEFLPFKMMIRGEAGPRCLTLSLFGSHLNPIRRPFNTSKWQV